MQQKRKQADKENQDIVVYFRKRKILLRGLPVTPLLLSTVLLKKILLQ
jgi:hypothetical protein